MSPRKKQESGADEAAVESDGSEFEPFTGSALKFVGRSDYFVAGVPQSDLKVVAEPQAQDEVTADKAAELVATGLYADKPAEQGGQGEVSNG